MNKNLPVNSMKKNDANKKITVSQSKSYPQRGRERQRSAIYWFILQMPAIAGAWQGQPGCGNPTESFTRREESQLLEVLQLPPTVCVRESWS